MIAICLPYLCLISYIGTLSSFLPLSGMTICKVKESNYYILIASYGISLINLGMP